MRPGLSSCACCGTDFGNMLRDNCAAKTMASADPATALPIISGIATRRDVLKGGSVLTVDADVRPAAGANAQRIQSI